MTAKPTRDPAPVLSPDHPDAPFCYSVPEAGQVLRISRTQAYALVKEGHLRSVSVGKESRVVPRAALLEFVQGGGARIIEHPAARRGRAS